MLNGIPAVGSVDQSTTVIRTGELHKMDWLHMVEWTHTFGVLGVAAWLG